MYLAISNDNLDATYLTYSLGEWSHQYFLPSMTAGWGTNFATHLSATKPSLIPVSHLLSLDSGIHYRHQGEPYGCDNYPVSHTSRSRSASSRGSKKAWFKSTGLIHLDKRSAVSHFSFTFLQVSFRLLL